MNKLILHISLIVIFAFTGCQTKPEEANTATSAPTNTEKSVSLDTKQMQNIGLTTIPLLELSSGSPQTFRAVLSVPPNGKLLIHAKTEATIQNVFVVTGEPIKKGDPIVSLSGMAIVDLQHQYLQAENALKLMKTKMKRATQLHEVKGMSDEAYEALIAEENDLKIKVSSAEERLQLIHVNPRTLNAENIHHTITLSSPINGYVAHTHVNKGQQIISKDLIATLVDEEDIHVEASIPEQSITAFLEGQSVSIEIPAFGPEKYAGKVHLVGRSIDPQEKSFQIHIVPTSKDMPFRLGLNAMISLDAQETETKIIPPECLVSIHQQNGLFVLEKNKIRFLSIGTSTITPAGATVQTSILPTQGKIVQNGTLAIASLFNDSPDSE